jgi:hypothetical protein
MLKPTGLIRGHYECRSFDQTLPILNDILALEVVAEKNGEKTLKHPNTDWRLVVHENGPDAPIKPMRNHYGVRVTSNAEVDRATEYLEAKKEQLGIKVIKPRENHNAYSVHFYEPGGNYWEIESYEHAVEAGMGETTNPHWTQPLPAEQFSAKGYVPQALTHGTLENEDIEASERFYREVLGLEVVKLWPSSCYVKHPATPWYGLPSSAKAKPSTSFPLSALYSGGGVGRCRSRGVQIVGGQSRGVENQRSREGRSHCRRGLFALQRSKRQLVGDHQRTIVVNQTQEQQPSPSGEFSLGRIPALLATAAATLRSVNFYYSSYQLM